MVLAFIAVVGGCRTYGGYGSEAATYQQMQKAYQVFQQELIRAQADLTTLETAASGQEILSLLATQYAHVVSGHEAVLAIQADFLEELSPGSDYRRLRRVFGAMIAGQNTIRRQYEAVLSNVYRGYLPPDSTMRVERPYAFIPPYYERIRESGRELSMSDVLAEVRSGRMAVPGFQIVLPDAGPSEPEANSEAEGHGH